MIEQLLSQYLFVQSHQWNHKNNLICGTCSKLTGKVIERRH